MDKNEELIRIFEFALNQEKSGKAFFQESLQRLEVHTAIGAFQRLIDEEESHIDLITRILQGLEKGQELTLTDMQDTKLKRKNFFNGRARIEFHKLCKESSLTPDVAIFNTAWLIEKDLSEYYERMAGKTEGNVKKAFHMLSEWERDHEKFFLEYRNTLLEAYFEIPVR